MKESKKIFEKIIKFHLAGSKISPEIAVASIIEFYHQHKIDMDEDDPDNDMLLFQYGTYDWDGQGKKFQLNVTRQIATPDDDEFYQVSLTLYYNPKEIPHTEDFNLWSVDSPSIAEWSRTIKDSEGFKCATKAIPFDYKIELSKT